MSGMCEEARPGVEGRGTPRIFSCSLHVFRRRSSPNIEGGFASVDVGFRGKVCVEVCSRYLQARYELTVISER